MKFINRLFRRDPIRWEISSATAIGGRDEQQDRLAAYRDSAADAVLGVVADGLGGHVGGALAAQCVIDATTATWEDTRRPIVDPLRMLQRACSAAHELICATQQVSGERNLSTCAYFFGDDRRVAWLHVGDSRIYHFRDGRFIERTRDHSLVQLLVEQGELREDEMADHVDQNLLLQSLGGERMPSPRMEHFPLRRGDEFVLCTDGLWESVSVDEMADALRDPSLPNAATRLVATATERRGTESDNVSVVMTRRRRGLARGTTAP